NLAALYHSQGKYSMAEDNYQRSLDIKLSLYGEDHLETAVNYHNLAMLYSAQRQYPRAEILYKRTLEVRENEYGKLHPELVPVLENYALMLKKANRPLEATSIETRLRNIKATS
ncbi:MAG: tetratricopeptide repeat protein, partial [Candidatus Obscuribacterales bacterium]|nr:tetratricopeptide repeat protein [Candidatus Obscuribacterales bacterium]